MENILKENMRRFSTKNLAEQQSIGIDEVKLHQVQNNWLSVTSEIESLIDTYFNDTDLKSGPTDGIIQHLKKIESKSLEKRKLEKQFNEIAAGNVRDLNLALNPWDAR
jgi:hypothetical protein